MRIFGRNGSDRDIKLLDEIYRLLGQEERTLVSDIGVPICMPNCGKCCEINSITVKGAEARYIALWLQGQKREFQEKIKDICLNWLLEKHENVGVYRGMGMGRMGAENVDSLQNDVSQLIHKTPCPMLDENKQCLIYPARPIACRTFGVTRVVQPDVCPRPLGKGEEGIYRSFRRSDKTKKVKSLIEELKPLNESKYMENGGFIATRLLIEMDPQKFLNLTYHNYIASAKLAQLGGQSILWQEQVDEQIDKNFTMSILCHPVRDLAEKTEEGGN